MEALFSVSRAFVADCRGITAFEYALIASIMVAAMAIAVPIIGTRLLSIFSTLSVSF